ncbi:MAG: hypothetical protein HYZ15_16235 [Sphingobacteriales bacterium]|nr:hypothetical protein [Sphingobacteriales bacterium]
MKPRLLSFAAAILSITFIFTSCKKEGSTSGTQDFTAETSTHSDDQSRFSAEVDAVANDANIVLESTAGFTGKPGDMQSIICDAAIDVDTFSNPRTITITYDGTNCLGDRTRTGVIVLSMAQGVHWKDAGAALSVSYQNFKVTRVSDNKSITINGTQTFTNVSGGLLFNLPTLNSITHTITSSNMSVTFDNGSQRTWQVARQRVFTYSNGGVTITITGMHTDGTITGIAEWGTNRFGRPFVTAIAEPVVLKSDCALRVGNGKVVHTTDAYSASATFGLDANGAPTACPGAGHYYMKIVWTGPAGNTHTALLPY